MRLASLSPGVHGFDCNTVITPTAAQRMRAANYAFAIRYVRRTTAHNYDITPGEVHDILSAGLGLMLVQHVAAPGWEPNATLGKQYGQTAAAEAKIAGYLVGAHLWCDLEGVKAGVPHEDVVAFCNEWHDAVKEAGFHPGLYVGDSCGLTPKELYRALRFNSYWSAYNLNAENYPATRGVMLRQHPYPAPGKRVAGVLFEYDEDVAQLDALGDVPVMVVA